MSLSRLLMLDNYDSFTYNLVQYCQEFSVDVEIVRNDAFSAEKLIKDDFSFYMISPGPASPNEAGCSLELVKECAKAKKPLLGVCLGHQSIAQAFGGKIVRAKIPMHGKLSWINTDGQGVFSNLPSRIQVTRYHSLIVDRDLMPKDFVVSAWTDDGEIMGIRHKYLSIEGVQFHPEAVLTEFGKKMIENFLMNSFN